MGQIKNIKLHIVTDIKNQIIFSIVTSGRSMDFVMQRYGAVLPLKVCATVCFGRYSGLVSYCLSLDKHPSDRQVEETKALHLPTTALVGGACSVATFFVACESERNKHLPWLIAGSVPLLMSVSRPLCRYYLRESTDGEWYRFKTGQSLLALAVFTFCTFRLAVEGN